MFHQIISEEHKRLVKWTKGGRILHCNLDGTVIRIEDYTKLAISKIVKFIEKDPNRKTVPLANLNAEAKRLFGDAKGFRLEEKDGSFYGMIDNTEAATNKITRTYNKTSENVHVYFPVSQNIKKNMRYQMIIDNDGFIQIEEFEAITPENLNMEYAEALLNVYETEVKKR